MCYPTCLHELCTHAPNGRWACIDCHAVVEVRATMDDRDDGNAAGAHEAAQERAAYLAMED
jgi:hypothetical protein